MGIKAPMAVQELGWDEDVDEALRNAIMDAIDSEFVEDPVEAVDAVMLWWRDEDGDLADGLVDALTDLSEGGVIWLLTPKLGRNGYIDAADVSEAALTAGLVVANPVQAARDWQAQKILRPRSSRR